MDRSGSVYHFTALTPVLAGAEAELRALVQSLPTGTASPFASIPGTHFGRWVVLEQLGSSRPGERVSRSMGPETVAPEEAFRMRAESESTAATEVARLRLETPGRIGKDLRLLAQIEGWNLVILLRPVLHEIPANPKVQGQAGCYPPTVLVKR